ncbi:MAG: Wzz/FepE/Etk N-terminal domain-containing protein, partial [Pseudomonadales bacterium]
MTRLNQNIVQIDKQWAATAEIDLRQYWQVISREKLKILALALGSGLLATLWVFTTDPIYEASATLLIESGSAKV